MDDSQLVHLTVCLQHFRFAIEEGMRVLNKEARLSAISAKVDHGSTIGMEHTVFSTEALQISLWHAHL